VGLREFFGRGRSESVSLDEFRTMAKASDKDLRKIIESGKVPQKSAKDLRKAAQEVVRKTEGERGFGALRAGLQGGGSRNHQNIPLRDRVHPTEYRRILEREAKKQGLL
jgi:hypothetical protein